MELLRELAAFALTIRVNTLNGPDPTADWDAIYEWADKLTAKLDVLFEEAEA